MSRENIDCCYGCTPETGRAPGCHAKCPEYLKQSEERRQTTEKRRIAEKVASSADNLLCRGAERAAKWKRQKNRK